jgi:predicted transcriptional regulator
MYVDIAEEGKMTRTGGADSGDTLSPAEIHDVLRNDRRRLVLERLREGAGTETVSDLAEHIGSVEAEESPPPRKVRQSVYVSLHQTHLPKLDDLGIVAYDADGKTVELDAHATALDTYLDETPDDTAAPATVYLGLGVLGAAALLATIAGVPGLRAVGPAAVGLVLSGLVIAVATYQLLE